MNLIKERIKFIPSTSNERKIQLMIIIKWRRKVSNEQLYEGR